ncbi:MAG: HAMP domain-containing protein [Spirochaetaceae bacterium]|jgi:signal transduction histidine kinase|nr:HAMP domain-containing protein [Spirochaetaceae bacterium]
MIRLRNYIAFIYAFFICITVFVLSAVINMFAEKLFAEYITGNIRLQTEEIIRSFEEQYDPFTARYNRAGIDVIGMHYLHQGYLVSLADAAGRVVWDVRDMDMEECAVIIEEISARMNNEYRAGGSFAPRLHNLVLGNTNIGALRIESYGPFFYRENEAAFLKTLNRFLLVSGAVFVLLSVIVSVCLASVIARPVLRARDAARRIAHGDFSTRIAEGHAARELHELSRAVNGLAEALGNGEEWQKRQSADIAHELRTPLTTLRGNIEAMIDGIWELSPERLESCLEEIVRLSGLVDDIAVLSLIRREHIVLSKTGFDLAHLAARAAEQFVPLAREKGVTLSVNLDPAPVYADYNRIMQVLVNLLSNAVKYTAQGNITVTLHAAASRGGAHHELSVADTGCGIAAEDLPHVFERFFRADRSRSRETGGTGIGLSIAAAIVEAHGGSIRAESAAAPGTGGSVFTATLPADISARQQ